ncbi:MAG: SusC/RagA family TonB-linked outer membrane protein [Puia sp.]|nr:SusC/RagA family TonB-linked outer membrane protein [Puia sp.]
MRLSSIFLLACCMQVSARGFTQGITLRFDNAPLEKVISSVQKATGYNFYYLAKSLDGSHPVSLQVKGANLNEVLDLVFKDQPVTYKIEADEKTILLTPKETIPETVAQAPPDREIKGKISDEDGTNIPAATIAVKGTKIIISANAEGRFTLKDIDEKSILVISCIGYETTEVPIKGWAEIRVYLKRKTGLLDETHIIAYGTTSQRFTTGDISKVSAEEIENQPVMNPLLALQGKVAGLDVSQTSGFASAPIKVELRGRSSIGLPNQTFPSDPLYVIDGVPLSIMELGGSSSYNNGSTGFLQNGNPGPAAGQSPFFSLDPSEIESIEVLKDADATSIYGSRGANGVILITTKKGKGGKTSFDLHAQEGATEVTRYYHLLNTPQYLEMRRQAFQNDGASLTTRTAYDLLSWDTTRYTDWQRAIYGKAGKTIDVHGSLTGGSSNTTFRIGADYVNTTNILTVSGSDQRVGASLNLSHKSLDQRFNIMLIGNYTYAVSDMVSLPGKVTYAPNAPAIYDSVGNLNYAGWGAQNSSARESYPFGTLKQPYTAKTTFQNNSLTLGYRLYKGLLLTSSFGYNSTQNNQQTLTFIASQDPASNPTGSNNMGTNTIKNWDIEPRLSYDDLLFGGKLSTLLGTSLQQNNTDGLNLTATGYTSDNLIKSISNGTDIFSFQTSGEYRYSAIYGRANYILYDKYILDFTGRRDGSSRFGPGKQYGNFGSAGAAWIFSEEDWFRRNIPLLSFGKLRGSYGSTGGDNVPEYGYLTQWSSNTTFPYAGNASIVPTQLSNPNYRWQVNRKLEGAINLGFLKDRFNLQVAYYRDRCGNQLVAFPLPSFNGFTSVVANSPALVQNSGWEFVAGAKIIDKRNFTLSVNANMAFNQNVLLSYPNFNLSPYVGQYIVGQPLNLVRLLHYTGVNPQTGQYTFYDKLHTNNVTVNYNGQPDDTYNHNLSPKYFGGFGMNFRYKTLQLVLFFNYKKQIGINSIAQNNYVGTLSNQPTFVLNRWQKPGDIAPVAKFTTRYNEINYYYDYVSDGAYTDASFIRLSNLALTYSLPGTYLKKVGLKGLSIFIHANNLFVITDYKGIDPETQNFGSMPPAKTLVGGVSFNF